MKSNLKLTVTGIFAAIAASLCCITPVLALISGVSGMAASFAWLEPLRPYLIGLSVVVLGVAWYQQLKPAKNNVDCACDTHEKQPFWQGKTFLSIVTVFAVVMMFFPYYSTIFYPDHSSSSALDVDRQNIRQVEIAIEGMTCQGCESHIAHEVGSLEGVLSVTADYEKGVALVKYNATTTDTNNVKQAIKKTGYKVVKLYSLK